VKRRPIAPFSLSFLDIMFCGFGAVVLLVLILDADTVRARDQTYADLRAQVVALEQRALTGRTQVASARDRLERSERERGQSEAQAERLVAEIAELDERVAALRGDTQTRRGQVQRLGAELRQLDSRQRELAAIAEAPAGDRLVAFQGEGDRQYLTGLKMGGERLLILLDASASMLDETLVNVVRRRHMDDAQRRRAPKWRRALLTAQWLLSHLPATARFQLYLFDTAARPAAPASAGRWLSAARSEDLQSVLAGLADSAPQGGTSLYHALAVAKSLSPPPDNILLVTDGLPTQGRDRPQRTTVTAEQRLAHFDKAVAVLPAGIPVNTVLLPMEGDAYAAAAYWKLGVDTAGSFLTPARDWP
jgi:ribosomal protein S15P/S13E